MARMCSESSYLQGMRARWMKIGEAGELSRTLEGKSKNIWVIIFVAICLEEAWPLNNAVAYVSKSSFEAIVVKLWDVAVI